MTATFVTGCGVCNLQNTKVLEYSMGHRSKNVEGEAENLPFGFCAMDVLGPYRVAQYLGSRLTSKLWVLIVMDLFSSEVQAYCLDTLTSQAVGMALCGLQAQKGTRIRRVYSDNYSSFGQAAIASLDLAQFNLSLREVLQTPIEPLQSAPNLSYSKHRSLAERRVRDIRYYLRQVKGSIDSRSLPIVTATQLQLVMDIICGLLNHVPLSSFSAVCPAHFSSPRTVPGVFVIPDALKALGYVTRMDAYVSLVNDAIVERLQATEKAVMGIRVGDRSINLQEGQTVWYYRSEDFPENGICFGEVVDIRGANSLIKVSANIEKELPNSRLHLFVPCPEFFLSEWSRL